jgi:flagellar motor switch protein FliN/FliY
MTATWVKKLETALEEMKAIPLWGAAPNFPWSDCSYHLAPFFQASPVTVSHRETQFRNHDEMLAGFGPKPLIQPVIFSSLEGTGFWVMSSADVAKLTSFALVSDKQNKGFTDPRFQEGFYHYLCLEAALLLNEIYAFGDLFLTLQSSTHLPKEGGICIDVDIKINGHTLTGRCICPSTFHHAFKHHFAQNKPSLTSSPLASEAILSLRIEAGSATLSKQEWNQVSAGDLILLDHAPYDPKLKKGHVSIALENTPLFSGKIKPDGIKITEDIYYLEETPMIDDNLPEEPEEEFSLSEEDHLDLEPAMETPADTQKPHLWTADGEAPTLEALVSSKEIPVTLTVEIAKFKMSLSKLLQLQPGNLIDLPVKPEEGVQLTINGKAVARGELVKIGDAIGVKILKVGH